MKTSTPFAGRPRLIELSCASIRSSRRTTARISLVLVIVAFGACLAGHAQPLGVDVVNSSYSASVTWWGTGSYSGDADVSGSNSVVSASPTSIDYINQDPSILNTPNYTTVWGESAAGLFQSYAFSNTAQGQYFNSYCFVSAISDILFSPLSSQTATLNLDFTGYANWPQSDCLVTLTDVTLGQTMWQYGWTAFTGAPGTPQFINLPQMNPDDAFTLTVPTAFAGGDTYELVMNTDANSNNDNGGAQVRLSGLVSLNVGAGPPIFVPEPSTFALIGSAVMLLVFSRLGTRAFARKVQCRQGCRQHFSDGPGN
jgi:hypothetical protein